MTKNTVDDDDDVFSITHQFVFTDPTLSTHHWHSWRLKRAWPWVRKVVGKVLWVVGQVSSLIV